MAAFPTTYTNTGIFIFGFSLDAGKSFAPATLRARPVGFLPAGRKHLVVCSASEAIAARDLLEAGKAAKALLSSGADPETLAAEANRVLALLAAAIKKAGA